mmetsp:Transcript_45764/g.82842  ORF Transcript_45764/g.82842 Transcript_45764/m.82842 type:complete len:152 (+) Transcript_45764:606-1061(+)
MRRLSVPSGRLVSSANKLSSQLLRVILMQILSTWMTRLIMMFRRLKILIQSNRHKDQPGLSFHTRNGVNTEGHRSMMRIPALLPGLRRQRSAGRSASKPEVRAWEASPLGWAGALLQAVSVVNEIIRKFIIRNALVIRDGEPAVETYHRQY